MDTLLIKDLKVRCIIGTLARERKVRQQVIINITLDCDCTKAGRSDDLNDAVNYKNIYDKVLAMTLSSKFMLIEKLADVIARICLSEKKVKQVTVRVDKPSALSKAASSAVLIKRSKKSKKK